MAFERAFAFAVGGRDVAGIFGATFRRSIEMEIHPRMFGATFRRSIKGIHPRIFGQSPIFEGVFRVQGVRLGAPSALIPGSQVVSL